MSRPERLAATTLRPPRLRLAALGLALVAAACASGDMRLATPPGLAGVAEELPVTARRTLVLPTRPTDDAVVFGDYRVMQYRAGWRDTTRRSVGIGGIDVFEERSWRKYSFELTAGDGTRLPVECAQRDEERGVGTHDEGGSTRFDVPWVQELRCTLRPADGEPWELAVLFGRGALTGPGGERLTVAPTSTLEGSRFEPPTPLGFVISNDGSAVAMVELISRGRYVLSRELYGPGRHPVVAAATALLLADSHD